VAKGLDEAMGRGAMTEAIILDTTEVLVLEDFNVVNSPDDPEEQEATDEEGKLERGKLPPAIEVRFRYTNLSRWKRR
jgi:hypothetical protein